MPCTLTQKEWQNLNDSIMIVDNLIDDPTTDMLGRELLLDVRARLLSECLREVEKCDQKNADTPIPTEDCPIYKILQAKWKKQREESHNGPDGFYS